MTTKRAQRAEVLERWAGDVDCDDLVEAHTAALRTIAELVEQRDEIDCTSRAVTKCSQDLPDATDFTAQAGRTGRRRRMKPHDPD